MIGFIRITSRKGKKLPEKITSPGQCSPEVMALVDEAANGNFEAFGQLYGMFLDKIYRYAYYQVKDKMTAEDITESVFIKAWKGIASCKGRGQTFSAWIYRIAHNQIVDTLQARQRMVSIELEDISSLDDPELTADLRFEYEELAEKIVELPQSQKQVIILKFIEGMDNPEISHILNKSEGAIRVLQMRALTNMREKLKGGRYRDDKVRC